MRLVVQSEGQEIIAQGTNTKTFPVLELLVGRQVGWDEGWIKEHTRDPNRIVLDTLQCEWREGNHEVEAEAGECVERSGDTLFIYL